MIKALGFVQQIKIWRTICPSLTMDSYFGPKQGNIIRFAWNHGEISIIIFLRQNRRARNTSTRLECTARRIGFDSRTLAVVQGAECIAPLFAWNRLFGVHVCGTYWQRFGPVGVHMVRFENCLGLTIVYTAISSNSQCKIVANPVKCVCYKFGLL